jgi:hypothetical protein
VIITTAQINDLFERMGQASRGRLHHPRLMEALLRALHSG